MKEKEEHVDALQHIRTMMERSSRFISLSGLSGVFAGFYALIGAAFAYWYIYVYSKTNDSSLILSAYNLKTEYYFLLIFDALLTLSLAVSTGFYFTYKKAKRKGLSIWDWTAKRVFIHLFTPLFIGGITCLVLIYHHEIYLVAGMMLLFYGLSLLNASHYTLHDIRYLGLFEILLGILAMIFPANGLLFWTLGFGLLHIIYGILMYLKYDRNN